MVKQLSDDKTIDLLPIPVKRGRKPLGEKAMSNAERQRLYREALNLRKPVNQQDGLKKMDIWLPDDMAQSFIEKANEYGVTQSDLMSTMMVYCNWDDISQNMQHVSNHQRDMLSVPISQLQLDNGTRNFLVKEGLETVGDICNLTETGLLKIPGFGRKSCNLVIMALHEIMVVLPK